MTSSSDESLGDLIRALELAGDESIFAIAIGEHRSSLVRLQEILGPHGFAMLRLGAEDPLGPGPRRRLLCGLSDLSADEPDRSPGDPGREHRETILRELNFQRDRLRLQGLQVVLFIEKYLFQEIVPYTHDLRAWASVTATVPPPRRILVALQGEDGARRDTRVLAGVLERVNHDLCWARGMEICVDGPRSLAIQARIGRQMAEVMVMLEAHVAGEPAWQRDHGGTWRIALPESARDDASRLDIVIRDLVASDRLAALPARPPVITEPPAASPVRPRGARPADADNAVWSGNVHIDTSHMPPAGPAFEGLEAELAELDASLADPEIHVVYMNSTEGWGMTALFATWLEALAAAGWRGIERVFAWSFAADPSVARFLDHALRFFGDSGGDLDNPWDRSERLAQLVNAAPTLMIMDGLSDDWDRIAYNPILDILIYRLTIRMNGLCLTTGFPLAEEHLRFHRAIGKFVLRMMPSAQGGALLHPMGIQAVNDGRIDEMRLRELQALRVVALFDAPVERHFFQVLRQAAIPGVSDLLAQANDDEWMGVLAMLEEAGWMRSYNGAVYVHPRVRDLVRRHLRDKAPDAWRAANQRLFDYFRTMLASQEPDDPHETQLVDRAMQHGRAAGLYQQALVDVFWPYIETRHRTQVTDPFGPFPLEFQSNFIRRGDAVGLDVHHRMLTFNWAGHLLQATGWPQRAPSLFGLAMRWHLFSDEHEAAVNQICSASVLMTLGRLGEAEYRAREAIAQAERSGVAFACMTAHAMYGAVLHQMGDTARARAVFVQAERIQCEDEPDYPMLYGLAGYWFCELLNDTGEHEETARRAQKAHAWAQAAGMKADIARAQLMLGRVHLATSELDAAARAIDAAMAGIKSCGRVDWLPQVFLARAALCRQQRDHAGARHDLDEARLIAERAAMQLVLADIDLEQTRLHLAMGEGDLARSSLEQARERILDTGYERRAPALAELDQELARGF